MNKLLRLAFGVAVMFAGLYGGAYAIHIVTIDHWAAFPIFMTAGFVTLGGVVGMIYIFATWDES